MEAFKKGQRYKDLVLLRPIRLPKNNSSIPAWECESIHSGEKFLIREEDLPKRKGSRLAGAASGVAKLLNNYKSYCKRRNIYWQLSADDVKRITSQKCSYCGTPPRQVLRNGSGKQVYTYNGIDRKNNGLGYTPDNSIPCCGFCNRIKSDLLSFEETRAAIQAILQVRKKKKGASA